MHVLQKSRQLFSASILHAQTVGSGARSEHKPKVINSWLHRYPTWNFVIAALPCVYHGRDARSVVGVRLTGSGVHGGRVEPDPKDLTSCLTMHACMHYNLTTATLPNTKSTVSTNAKSNGAGSCICYAIVHFVSCSRSRSSTSWL